MARQPRVDVAGEVYHIINRSNARWTIFKAPGDFNAVLDSIEETFKKVSIDIFSFVIMPNHWHFAVRSKIDGDLGRFFGKFTQKVTQRWHSFHHSKGSGHLFQGRFKSFLVSQDSYFMQVMKYIDANPLRARLVEKAEYWEWGSLYQRQAKSEFAKKFLAPWLVGMPEDYVTYVNKPLEKEQIKAIRNAAVRGCPFGNPIWTRQMVEKYNLDYSIRREGRPSKE